MGGQVRCTWRWAVSVREREVSGKRDPSSIRTARARELADRTRVSSPTSSFRASWSTARISLQGAEGRGSLGLCGVKGLCVWFL